MSFVSLEDNRENGAWLGVWEDKELGMPFRSFAGLVT